MSIKAKRRIAECIGWLCLVGMLCVVGGTERGWIPISAMWWAFVLEAIGAAALYKAGVIRL